MAANRVTLHEDLTIYHAAEHKQQLLDALAGDGAVEVDLSQVGEIDTAGLQLLILGKREALRRGGDFRIVAHSPEIRRTIDFCNLTGFFGDPVVITAREGV
jgi:anti-sigma B factor antagonist